jgi:broad specificity phosphatase PhoE
MTTLLVARHGEADWNAEHRWLGQTDRPLTSRGREQARELGRRLADVAIAAAYASDLSRAVETARVALEGRGVEVISDPALRERFLGSWEGLHDEEIPRRFPEEYARVKAGVGYGAPDAESYASVADRVLAAVRRIAAAHPDDVVLLVSHSRPVRVIAAAAAGLDPATAPTSMPQPGNGEVVRYAVEAGRIRPLG